MMAKKTITAVVRDIKYELEGSLLSAIQTLQNYSGELGPTAKLSIGEAGEPYDYSDAQYAYVKITVEREETDEEYALRQAHEEAHRLRMEERDRNEYERLQAKFKQAT